MTLLEHVHVWAPFANGRGCQECSAWEFYPESQLAIDPLPTRLFDMVVIPSYVQDVRDPDLVLEVMSDLVELLQEHGAAPSWSVLEGTAIRLIERIQGA